MVKANRLTAKQILRFRPGVQQRRAVCSTSCGVQTNSACSDCLVSPCRMCLSQKKERTKPESKGVVSIGGIKSISPASGADTMSQKHIWLTQDNVGIKLICTTMEGFFFFEIWKSNVQAPHLFLPVGCSVREGYCNIGV